MARICPQCSLENSDQVVFCSRCGFRFSAVDDVIPLNNPSPATPPDANYAGYAPLANPPQSYEPSQQPVGPVPYTPQPSPITPEAVPYTPQPSPTTPEAAPTLQPGVSAYGYGGSLADDPYSAPGGAYQQPQQMGMQPPLGQPGMQPPQGQPGMQPPLGQQYFQPPVQRSGNAVQRAFAGKGTPLMHTSWLLDGKQVSPVALRLAIVEKVQQHYPSEVRVSQERLAERDVVLEERDYVRIERAPANVFIYVTSFGRDLYISRTTTVQPTLSPVRIAVLGALFLLMLIGFIVAAASDSSLIISLFSALLLIFFVAIAIHSLVLWLTEKDFLAYLRPNVLNDFRTDDNAILEHIADRGIREAAEGSGLDAGTLSTPARNYPARQPLHWI